MSKKTILLFLSIVLSSCLLEGLLRIHFHLLDPIEQAKRISAKFDAVFGWDIKKNHEYKITDSGFYKVDERGFRFSPLTHNKDKKTILLIGDSFTHASNLANQDVYYRKLDDLKVNFYSYGVSGWSNLQEFLKVQEHITKIHPDIIIWQLSANDLIENVYQIEKRLGKKSYGRPYINDKGSDFYDFEIDYLSKFRSALNQSRAIAFVFNGIHSIIESTHREITLSSSEKEITINITKLIFSKMKKSIPENTKIIAFNAGPLPFDQKLFKDIALNSGFIYLEEIEDAINLAKASGKPYFTPDAFHWTKEGHQFIQSLLTPKIEEFLDAK